MDVNQRTRIDAVQGGDSKSGSSEPFSLPFTFNSLVPKAPKTQPLLSLGEVSEELALSPCADHCWVSMLRTWVWSYAGGGMKAGDRVLQPSPLA